jgi:hypothetical protein
MKHVFNIMGMLFVIVMGYIRFHNVDLEGVATVRDMISIAVLLAVWLLFTVGDKR